jgi:hypothetical protein
VWSAASASGSAFCINSARTASHVLSRRNAVRGGESLRLDCRAAPEIGALPIKKPFEKPVARS